MKPSNYNFFFPYEPDDSKLIAYNSFSNSLALMDKSQHSTFERFCKEGVEIADDEFVEQLEFGCFLIEDDVNELDRLRFRMLRSRYNTDYLSLTIAPTADCNFRCAYCYEKDVIKPTYMSEEVQKGVVELVKSCAKTISSLSVTWYGGEPLMAIDIVEKLSREFMEICAENNIEYGASMVTNGYFLTKSNVELLNDLKVGHIQVTIDGNKEVHDKRRPLAGGVGTFDTIMANLTDNIDILPPVGLRINVDKDNLPTAADVAKIVKDKGLGDKVSVHLGKVLSFDNVYDGSKCFNMCDFSQEEFGYYKETGVDLTWRYPRTVQNVCAADSVSAHIIGADGKLYKCWSDIGDSKKCVGSLSERLDSNEDVFFNYMLFDPTDITTNNMCAKCNLLPVCMGGCPYKRLSDDKDNCTIYKFVLQDYLSVIAEKLKIQRDEVAEK
ncbi:MAG: SPASM domain-containing protein [Turicibacter sp.]|nr:SPASM domain-containing protein [Turicibacter sp.]